MSRCVRNVFTLDILLLPTFSLVALGSSNMDVILIFCL